MPKSKYKCLAVEVGDVEIKRYTGGLLDSPEKCAQIEARNTYMIYFPNEDVMRKLVRILNDALESNK